MFALSFGLLILRLGVGLTFAAHGAQKAFGWWGGPGFEGWHTAIARMGFRPVSLWTLISVAAELLGGLLLALGLLTPLAAGVLIAQSVVIIGKVHLPNGFWNQNRGLEFPLALAAGAVALAATGPGSVALDAFFGFAPDERVRLALIPLGVTGGLIALAIPRLTASLVHAPAG